VALFHSGSLGLVNSSTVLWEPGAISLPLAHPKPQWALAEPMLARSDEIPPATPGCVPEVSSPMLPAPLPLASPTENAVTPTVLLLRLNT